MVTNVPNFILYVLFNPLGSRVKEITGHDVLDININDTIKAITIPTHFTVSNDDTVSGREQVKRLYTNCGGRLGIMHSSTEGYTGVPRDT